MSAVVYDVGYDIRMILKKEEKRGYCTAFDCYKRKKNFARHRSSKTARFRSILLYLSSGYRILRHTSYHTADNLNSDRMHGIKTFLETCLRF